MTHSFRALTTLLAAAVLVAGAGVASAQPVTSKALAPLVKQATACTMLHPARCEALKKILAYGADGAGPALVKLMGEKDPAKLAAVVAAAGQLRVTEVGPKLLPLLESKDQRLRMAAITATGRVNPEGAVAALGKALGATDVNEKLVTSVALGATGSPAALTTLVSQLSHFHPKVKSAAARALGALGDKRATEPLAVLLAEPEVRWPAKKAASDALGKIGDPDGAPMLLLMLGHAETAVRTAAITALGAMGDQRAVAALGLLMRQEELSLACATALGRIKHADALPALIRVLKERRLPQPVIEKTFWAVGEIKSASAVTALKPMLKDDDPKIAMWACDALGRIGDLRASEALLDALRRDEQEVKEMAAWALQQLSGINLGLDIERWESWVYSPDRPQ